MPVYKVTIKDKTYTVEVPNPRERPVHVTVDGEPIEVLVQESGQDTHVPTPVVAISNIPAAPPSPPPSSPAVHGTGEIIAPLPGVVTTISVKVGDAITPGQELCILEAMKMNNPIRATITGTVKAVHVSIGQQVQHGAPLLTVGE